MECICNQFLQEKDISDYSIQNTRWYKKKIHTQRVQLNQKGQKVKIASTYRKEMLNHLSVFIYKQENINNIIIIGDWNKNVNSNEM